jgi:hypothetical protein
MCTLPGSTVVLHGASRHTLCPSQRPVTRRSVVGAFFEDKTPDHGATVNVPEVHMSRIQRLPAASSQNHPLAAAFQSS